MSNILKVINLECHRSDEVIFKGLNFEIDRGDNLEIIGSNGSGKTTVLRLLLGLIPNFSGEIHWSTSQDSSKSEENYTSCFYQGHQIGIKPLLTAYENLKFSTSGFNSSDDEITLVAKRVGIEGLLNRRSSDLSAGQKKRIAIGRWLLKDFNLYLLDEPFTALDDKGIKLIEDLIAEMNSRGSSFLITGHRPSRLNSHKIYLDQ